MTNSQVLELKEKGNECLKKGNYIEAMIHYTHALKLDPNHYQLYSNRSFAFLKLQQYYYALEDAKQTIFHKPDWAKGYFRKGEVEFHTEHYSEAIESYRKALQLEDDPSLIEAIRKAKRELFRLKKADIQYPWIGAGVGFIVGALLVTADTVLIEESFLQHPFLKVLLVIVTVCICFAVMKWHRYYLGQYRKSLIQIPIDLFENQTKKSKTAETEQERKNK